MRIITEDNIDQLLSLSYQSKNIDKLLNIDHGDENGEMVQRNIKEIIDNYKKNMSAKANVIVQEARVAAIVKNQQQQQEVLQPRSPEENTTFKLSEIVVVKNEETRAKFPATVIKVTKNDQGEELYNVRYFDDEEERNVGLSRITPYEQKQENVPRSPIIPRSPEESPPPSPVYSPRSPEESPEEGILGRASSALNVANDKLGELGESISSSVSNAVTGAEDTIKEGLESLANMIPGSSPQSPQSAGGIGPFASGQMNSAFNQLSPEKRATLMQLGGGQREEVMSRIMAQASSQAGGGLNQYFSGLPVSDQLKALQNTYSQKATQFKQMAGKVNAPIITTYKPHSAAEEMYGGKLGLFAPIEADKIKIGGSDDDNSNNNNSSSSSDSTSNTSSGVKVVKM